jgi:hypothetical protein
MPTTQANVTMIQRRVSNASLQEIIDAFDEVQLIVYSQNCFQTQKILSTGMPPLLVTNDSVYEYDCPSDCRKTAAVFSESPAKGYSRNVGNERQYYYSNKSYVQADCEGRDANISSVAKIRFRSNPGTTTDKYHHLYYIKPTRITDISIELTLPEETHYLLRKGVVSMFTTEGYGESPYDSAVIEKVAKEIRKKLNSGMGSTSGLTPFQPQYLDYPGSR